MSSEVHAKWINSKYGSIDVPFRFSLIKYSTAFYVMIRYIFNVLDTNGINEIESFINTTQLFELGRVKTRSDNFSLLHRNINHSISNNKPVAHQSTEKYLDRCPTLSLVAPIQGRDAQKCVIVHFYLVKARFNALNIVSNFFLKTGVCICQNSHSGKSGFFGSITVKTGVSEGICKVE